VTEQGGGTGGPDSTTCAWTTARGYNLNSLSWLVSPDCYAADALSFTRWVGNAEYQVWATLPFKFPMGDKFYDRVYFDTTGRLEPRETFGACASDAACTSSYSECAGGLCTCLAAFGNQCVYKPGGYIYEPSAKSIFAPYSAGGNAPVLSAAWGAFDLKWNKDGNKGYMTAQTVVFEGTLAYVISWVGMDVSSTTGNFDK